MHPLPQVEGKSDGDGQNSFLFVFAREHVSQPSLKRHSFMFLVLFCSSSAHFAQIQLVCDGRTGRPLKETRERI